MKNFSWFRLGAMLLAMIVLFSSCRQDDEPASATSGSIQFGFSAADISKGGRIQTGDVASVLVTVTDTHGQVVANNKQLTLYAFGDGYLSEPIALTTGQYKLSGFVVLNNSNNAVYAAPVRGSALDYLVTTPLPIDFPVTKDIVSNVNVEVIAVDGNSAKDFGYTTFSFDIIDTFTFNMAVIAQDKSALTDGRIVITSGTTTVYDKTSVAGITTRVQVRNGYTSYAVNVTKDGYLPYSQIFTAEKLKHYITDSVLTVNLIRNTDATVNSALQFDGIDDYVDLGNIYDDLALPVSISAWVFYPNQVYPPSYQLPLFVSQDNLPLYNGINFAITPGDVHCGYGDGRGENSSAYRIDKAATLTGLTGRWVHIAANVRGYNDIDLFVDGVDVGGVYTGDTREPMSSNSPQDVAKIGTMTNNGLTCFYKGAIDELRIWNRSLSASEIKANMKKKLTGSETGLIGYWSFDEASGNTLIDSSPSKYNGVIKGNPVRIQSGAF